MLNSSKVSNNVNIYDEEENAKEKNVILEIDLFWPCLNDLNSFNVLQHFGWV